MRIQTTPENIAALRSAFGQSWEAYAQSEPMMQSALDRITQADVRVRRVTEVDKILAGLPWINEKHATAAAKLVRSVSKDPIERSYEINRVLQYFATSVDDDFEYDIGVIRVEDIDDERIDLASLPVQGVYGEPVAEYVNTGETYDPTVLYDFIRNEWNYGISWGDWLEELETNSEFTYPSSYPGSGY